MSSPQHEALQKSLTNILGFEREKLLQQSSWGTINFMAAEADIDKILSISQTLNILPTSLLPRDLAQNISTRLNNCTQVFDKISKFNIELPNPKGTRDGIITELAASADALFKEASIWIPYLAYQHGDVQRNISQLNSSVTEASTLYQQAKADISQRSKEISQIITDAREASAAAGAAVFTKEFNDQSNILEKQALIWLRVTIFISIVTLAAAVFFYFRPLPASSQLDLVQRVTSKLAVLGILITGTLWCGRVYKAIMHQASCYRFKALGLQTFKAFSAGADDPHTKDAVLLETTRSIFSNSQTGYIESPSSNDTQIVEVLKSAVPNNGA